MFWTFLFMKIPKIHILTEAKLKETISDRISEAQSGVDDDEELWRPITSDINRDLNPIKHDRMIDIVYKFWLQNPLAKMILTYKKVFVCGSGVTVKAKDDDIQEIINDFWNDSVNKMDLTLPEKVEALFLFGEQIYPAIVSETSGKVRLAYVDPKKVDDIIMQKGNSSVPEKIKLLPKSGEKEKYLDIIHLDEDPKSETYRRLIGDVFLFQINKMPNSHRGCSDLLPLTDWLDAYDQFLFSAAERSVLMNLFIWDITMEGKSDIEIKKYLRNHGKPTPASLRGHNEKVKWEAVAPDLKSGDTAEIFRILRTQIIGGAGFPLHFFGDGSDANLATAGEMGWPTMKMLEERQRYVKYMIECIIKFCIDQAMIHRKSLNGKEDESFEIIFPDISKRDITKISAAFQQAVMGLVGAINSELMSTETAMSVMSQMTSQFGIETPDDETDKIKADITNKENVDYVEYEK